MVKAKHILIMKSLNREEMKLLSRFIYSPMHNSNKNLIKLFEYVKTLHPDYPDDKTSPEILHKKIFPAKPYNEKIIRNLIYEFTDKLELFLALNNFINSKIAITKHLLEESELKKLGKISEEHLKKAETILSEVYIKDESYYSSKAFIELKRFAHEFTGVPLGKSLALSNIKEEYIKNTSCFFILSILTEYFNRINRANQIKSTTELKLAEKILDFLDTEIENYKEETPIYLLYRFLKLNNDTGIEAYYELKQLTIENLGKISKSYFKDFIFELYNYCKNKQQHGLKEFGGEAFELLKFMDDKNLFTETDNTILEHNYTNCVASAVRVGKNEWALEFIEKYKPKLPKNIRENAYCYNLAVVCFIKGVNSPGSAKKSCFEDALCYLGKVRTNDFFHTTRVNNLKLLLYYELTSYEPAYSLIDTYRHFLHNNSLIPETLKSRYLNFINFMNRLFNIKTDSRKTSIDKLKLDVINGETEYKKWIISKIEELE